MSQLAYSLSGVQRAMRFRLECSIYTIDSYFSKTKRGGLVKEKLTDLMEFGKVWVASGARGFFGEGYWFHRYLKPFGLDFDEATFTAKTTTLLKNEGNMALKQNFTPRDRFPDCIFVNPKSWLGGYALNAVGLSGPGALRLIDTRKWQNQTKPFFLSFMSTKPTRIERLGELDSFITLLTMWRQIFVAPFGLQLNYSCPNTGHALDELLQEVDAALAIAANLGVLVVVKLNAMTPIEVARDISKNPNCAGLCVSNTIPYGQLPDRIAWEKNFGPVSPLKKYGGGGYSGKELLPILLSWLHRARQGGITNYINGGGGILSLEDAKSVIKSGADSISLGSIAFLRPWRVRGIIRAINASK